MYIFGHIGITVAAVRAIDGETDLRLPILLSILPDLIDKPMEVILPVLVNGNTRNFGHTLLGALSVLAVLLALRRRLARPLLLWACYAGHFLLDRIWLTHGPIIFFWPFLGTFPRRTLDERTPYLVLYNILGELLGFGILLGLARRHRLLEAPRWDSFVRTGRLQSSAQGS